MPEQPKDQRDYRPTVFLPKTDFPMKAGLPQKEPGIAARWESEGLYQQIRKSREGREKFILHDGPPYANGDMHIGHALNHVLKDMVVRTQTLLGKDAPYVPGWDCHGLPIEWKVEEQYRKKKLNKDEVPAKEFRAECRAYAQHWVDTQREQLKRLGIGGDWDNPYLTMQFESEAVIVSELLKFAESGQLYRGAKPVMWSPVEKTALAEAEVEYEDIVSTQIDLAFEIVESPIPELVGAHAVIWTTTPWTIPVNQALAYGSDVEYTLYDVTAIFDDVGDDGEAFNRALTQAFPLQNGRFLIARELEDAFRWRLNAMLTRLSVPGFEKAKYAFLILDHMPVTSVGAGGPYPSFKGSHLAGTIARHPMAKLFSQPGLVPGQGFSSADAGEGSTAPEQVRGDNEGGAGSGGWSEAEWERAKEFFLRPRPFLPGDFVTTESGTGLVHMAPDHGEDDFDLCKAHGINPVFAVEGDGRYREDWAWLGGQGSVINPKFNAPDGPICSDLREAGALLAASADYQHSYPHSWRSKAKVIFRCTPQWFVPMDRPLEHIPLLSPREERWENEGGNSVIDDEAHAGSPTLRELALGAIRRTRFVPEKGRNRIGSMVEGRPDWVLSRQRAWGVPITLFVNRKSGEYLVDKAVNARIVAAVREQGVDAWEEETAQALLGSEYDLADFERVTDILDVWFDSGSTHAFVLESGRWPELKWPADLYLEGSDQHRGWFQSSLLESCGTRGRAPYEAVLTHGFTMAGDGRKMSKSLGNTVDPIKVMEQYGADIIRLWALSVDYTEDHRISDEILKGVADQYRKLRNTFRYLLGALDGFDEAEKLAVAEMPELERYVLALLGELDATLRQAVADFDFNDYVRALVDFCNEDLSAFYFDIRKDSLYCDAPGDLRRRACRTVLDTLFHALVRYAAPVLVFTSEEVWGTRFPDAGSVHLLEWPDLPFPGQPGLVPGQGLSSSGAPEEGSTAPGQVRGDSKWERLRALREKVTEAIEPLRREKVVRSGLEASVIVPADTVPAGFSDEALAELFISGPVSRGGALSVGRTDNQKCGRCWRLLPEVTEDGALCARCEDVLRRAQDERNPGMDAKA